MVVLVAQSNVIAFCLFFAFIVFITLRGELPKYLDVLFTTKGGGSSSGGGGGSSGGGGLPGVGAIGNALENLTGDDTIGRAVTSIREGTKSFLGLGGAAGGIFQ
jgi:hypothetical protein